MKYRFFAFILFLLSLSICMSCKDGTINWDRIVVDTQNLLKELEEGIENDFSKPSKDPLHSGNSISKFKNYTLVSWNIQHMGRSKTEEDIQNMAQILKDFDIVAIQEVVAKDPAGAQAVARLADALNRTGAAWDYQVSNSTISPSVYISERYAFLWKTSKVDIQHRAFLDKEREDLFYREPFIARFREKKTKKLFYIANYHSRKHSDRPQEEIIHLIDYSERWGSPYVLIAGDFNVTENDKVWIPFYNKGFQSALKNTKTTLKQKCNDAIYLNHSIDNIFYTPRVKRHQAQAIDFVETCENLQAARSISDHLPIFIEFSLE